MKRNKLTRWLKRLLLLVLLASGVGYARWYWQEDQASQSIPRFDAQKVSRGDLAQTITASGELDPVTKVEVGSQISGNIQNLFVDFNSPVQQGQILASLDSATFEANVAIAEGSLSNACADLELARINEARAKSLRSASLNPQAEYDLALA